MDPRLHIVESGMVGSGALSLLCGKCTTVIVGGSIPYCKGHWGSMSRGVATRAKGEHPVRIRLCRPDNVGGGDSGTDRDAAMGKDTSFYLRRLLRE